MLNNHTFSHPVDKRDMKRLVKWWMTCQGIRYPELAQRFQAIEVGITPQKLANRIRRGAFSAVFLVQIFMALGADEIKIERLIV